MPTIIVDGKSYEVGSGKNLLEACLDAGLDLPYFCWHPAMGSIGSCRQCALVQYRDDNDQHGRIIMGCMTPATDGTRVSLEVEKAKEFREAVVESLMLNHPHDCPVCSEGGECHLQDMTVMVGHRDRRYKGKKNTHRNQYLGPLINHEMNRCITCYRCERFYRDYAGGKDLSSQASRDRIYFGRHQDGVLESEFSGNLVEVCPTGVFTDKPFLADYTRKWDLQSSPSICGGCGVGCNISPGERYGRLKRIHNRYNQEINGYFICDRGRFGAGYVNGDKRTNYVGVKESNSVFKAIKKEEVSRHISQLVGNGNIVGIGSPRASVESNFLLQNLVGPSKFSSGLSDTEDSILKRQVSILKTTRALNPSVRDIELADAILILGEDLTNTAARIALAVRQATRGKAIVMAEQMGIQEWQDGAVRNLAQAERSPLFIATAASTKLDDIALKTLTLAPEEIAEFGLNLASQLTEGNSEDRQIIEIATYLTNAKRPLIISGPSLLNKNIVESAAAVAEALAVSNKNTQLSFTFPEANSVGSILVGQPQNLKLSEIIENINQIDALIVLENDLSRRLSASEMTQLHESPTKIISIDLLEHDTLEISDVILPAASFAETQGTLVNYEGRAQRFYSVFPALHDRLPSWQWLVKLAAVTKNKKLSGIGSFDEVAQLCAKNNNFQAMSSAAPDKDFRDHGLKIPRQTHRNSGRTAVTADVSVHEVQQLPDDETPLTYSMEGLNRDQPSALTPFVWSPGWNSNQSLQKFQAETDGPLKGGTSGVQLIKSSSSGVNFDFSQMPSVSIKKYYWRLVPIYCLHGSEELSLHTKEIAELAGSPFIVLSVKDADNMKVSDRDGVIITGDNLKMSLSVRISERMAEGCAGYSAGYNEIRHLTVDTYVHIDRDNEWQPLKPVVIATDRIASFKSEDSQYV
mgnify:FL=1